jgi:hypothetical protein
MQKGKKTVEAGPFQGSGSEGGLDMTLNGRDQGLSVADRGLLGGAIAIMVVAWPSLFLAYVVCPSEAWGQRFGLGIYGYPRWTGALVDGVTSLIYFAFLAVILGPKFCASRRMLISADLRNVWANICRLVFVLVLALFGYMVIAWHFSTTGDCGPAELHTWATENPLAVTKGVRSLDPEAHALTYAVFFPYSLVLYVLISPLLIALPLHSFGIDMGVLRRETSAVVQTLERGESKKTKMQAFRVFKQRCLTVAGRYLAPLGILSIVFFYTMTVGRYVMSKGALHRVEIGYGILSLAFAYLLVIACFYSSAFSAFKSQIDDPQCWSGNNMKSFFLEMLLDNVHGFIIFGFGCLLLALRGVLFSVFGIP